MNSYICFVYVLHTNLYQFVCIVLLIIKLLFFATSCILLLSIQRYITSYCDTKGTTIWLENKTRHVQRDIPLSFLPAMGTGNSSEQHAQVGWEETKKKTISCQTQSPHVCLFRSRTLPKIPAGAFVLIPVLLWADYRVVLRAHVPGSKCALRWH